MFLEPHFKGQRSGWIEVICGSMFSGKTEELIRRLKRAKNANQKVEIFKPGTDTRYDTQNVVSHDANSILATPVDHSSKILDLVEGISVIGIDEAQFFDDEIVNVCNDLANRGIRVIVAGLDMDFQGNPFGPMPALLTLADDVVKLNSVCTFCSGRARFSHRITQDEGIVVLGEKDKYVPLCRSCYVDMNIKKKD